MDVKKQIRLHHCLSIVGGFLGGYALYNHVDVFGNAQTANLIKLVLSAVNGHFDGILFLVLSFLVYAAGNVFYVIARRRLRLSMKIVSLIMTSAAVAVIGIFPNIRNDVLAILPIIFVTPIQWNAYKTAGGNSSSTIFSSNNVRQAVTSLTRYALDRDKKSRSTAAFYWATLLCFHLGVALAGFTGMFFGTVSIWFCYIPLAISAAAYYDYHFNSREEA